MDTATCPVCMWGIFFLPKIYSCLYVTHIRRTGDVKASSNFNFCTCGSILIRANVEGGTVLTCRCVAENRWRTEPSAWQLTVAWDVSEHSCVLVLGEASVVTLLVSRCTCECHRWFQVLWIVVFWACINLIITIVWFVEALLFRAFEILNENA